MDWKEEILKKWKKKEIKKYFVTDSIRDRLAKEFRGEVLYQENMAPYTSIRVGGAAEVLLKPKSLEDIKIALKIALEEEIPYFIFGSGSNTLIKDKGVRGFVICPGEALQRFEVLKQEGESGDVLAEAGVKISSFVTRCGELGLSGMEALIGIPGSMGGAIAMNAGARGVEIKDIVREICVLDNQGEIKTLSREKLEFHYRQLKIPRSQVILSGTFRLKKDDPQVINGRILEFKQKRVSTQPLSYPNLGSIFKNPQPAHPGAVTATAGQLIEETGLKNVRVGGARVSEKHANFIINERNATANDVIVLIDLVRDKIKERTGISLETEIKIIGEDS